VKGRSKIELRLVIIVLKIVRFSFGLTPVRPLQVVSPLIPGGSQECSLPLNTSGAVQRMDPLTNLQVSISEDNITRSSRISALTKCHRSSVIGGD